MARTKGATSKNKQPIELTMTEEQRLRLLADLILETITAEQEREQHAATAN